MKAFVVVIVMCVSALTVKAGFISPNDFVYPQVTTFDGLGITADNPTGLPFNIHDDTTIGRNTYSAPLRYTDFLYAGPGNCVENECLGEGQAGGTMTITLGTPVDAAGFYVGVSPVTVIFYNAGTQLMPAQTVDLTGATAPVWFGWRSDGALITSVEIDGLANNKIFTIDNFTAELPEPGTTGMLLGAGLLAAASLRRNR